MIEAYRIGVNLALSGTISTDIAKVGAQFDALNVILNRSKMALNELASGMRALRNTAVATAEAWTQAARAMERAAAAGKAANAMGAGAAPAAAGTGMAAVAAALASRGNAQRSVGAPGGPLLLGGPGGSGGTFAGGPGSGGTLATGGGGRNGGPIPLNLGASGGSGMPAMPGHTDLAMATAGYGALGYGIFEFMKNVTGAGVEVGHLKSQLTGLGMSADQATEALKISQQQQRETPGITTAGTMTIIRDLMTTLQNAKEALDPETIQSFSRAAVILGASGKGDAVHELFKSMQAGELRGVLKAGPDGNISTATLETFLKNVITTTLVTGGRVGPSEQLQFIKSSGLGGAMLTDPALFADAIAPILSMGAARAGTGVQAFAQQFAAGKMSDAGAKMLLGMGLVTLPPGHQDLKEYKAGIGQYRFPPSVLSGFEQARTTPTDWIMQVLLPKLDAYMTKTNGKAPANEQELMANRMAGAAAVASRIPGGNLIGDIIRNYALIERDRTAIASGNQRDAWANSQTDPRVKMEALSAALNGLFVALSGPVMDTVIGVVRNLTNGLNMLSTWAQNHPDTAGRLVEIAAGLGTLSIAIAGISAALLVAGPMIRLAKYGAGVAGAAGSAAAGTSAGAATVGILGTLARWASPVAGFLYGMSPTTANAGEAENVRRLKADGAFGPQSGVAPMQPKQQDMKVELRGPVTLDGRAVGNVVASGIAKAGSGPSSGTTGFDLRGSPIGAGSSIP